MFTKIGDDGEVTKGKRDKKERLTHRPNSWYPVLHSSQVPKEYTRFGVAY